MKNNLQKSQRKNTGFTLLELVVVVAVMGLISSMAMDVYTDNSNQKRFEATKERLAEIKFAIIGDPMMRVGSQAVLSGYYNDMDRLPKSLSELIYKCRTSTYVGVISANQSTCEATAGNVWETDWKGPYLHNLQSSGGNLVFQDAWGNSSAGNFGWTFSDTASIGSLQIQSRGLDRGVGSSSTNPYDNDYPVTSNYLVSKAETDQIDYLKLLQLTGYCVNTTTKVIDTSIKDQLLCSDTWITFPIAAGYCVDKAVGTIDATIITSAACTGTDEEWVPI